MNSRYAGLAVALVLCVSCGGGGGSSSPIAPTPTPTITSIVLGAGRTTLQVGETTGIYLFGNYSNNTVLPISTTEWDCTPTNGSVISIIADCTVTALALGTSTYNQTFQNLAASLVITVADLLVNLVFHEAAGGPDEEPEPYWWHLSFLGDPAYFNEESYAYFGGYEGHGKNTGDGCARNVTWTFTAVDTNDALLELDSGSLLWTQIIQPGEVFEFEGCCLEAMAQRILNGVSILTDLSGEVEFSSTEVACP